MHHGLQTASSPPVVAAAVVVSVCRTQRLSSQFAGGGPRATGLKSHSPLADVCVRDLIGSILSPR